MKIRNGFVSNSSSCSFYIYNKSGKVRNLVDFVKENPQFIKDFRDTYDWYTEEKGYTQEALIASAEARVKQYSDPKWDYDKTRNGTVFPCFERTSAIFGDEQGDLIGHVFDYILRQGGSSKNFEWYMDEMMR